MIPPGLEPGTLCVLGTFDNHYTTESKRILKLYDTQTLNVALTAVKMWFTALKMWLTLLKMGYQAKKHGSTRLIVYGYGQKNEAPKEENEARDAVFGYLSKIKKLVFYFG